MRLERTPFVTVERTCREPLHRHAVEPVPEHEQLGEPVARGEQCLLDLRRRQPELAARLGDAHAVQLAQHVHLPLPLGQRGERRHERARHRLRLARGELGHLVGRKLAPPHDEVDRRVVRDAVEPGAHLVRHAAFAQRAVGLEERRLRDVVAGRRVGEPYAASRWT